MVYKIESEEDLARYARKPRTSCEIRARVLETLLSSGSAEGMEGVRRELLAKVPEMAEAAGSKRTLAQRFHALWGMAGRCQYDKAEWLAFQADLQARGFDV